ncbi:MAG: TIGR01459 family HAD-type hydrolase [Pseudomonadota bacterium]
MTAFSELIPHYDGFIFDQYGVLHDGQSLYSGAQEALNACHDAGKPAVMLTNSGRSAKANATRLSHIGLDASSLRAIVTSGDLALSDLAAETGTGPVFVIARGGATLDLPKPQTKDPEAAGFLLIAGSSADRISETAYRELLRPLAERGVRALCSNPDLQMLTPSGLRAGAGRIAAWYEEMGGAVSYTGKPWPAIYRAAVAALDLPQGAKICCVGDSLHHDILGATRVGLASILVRTGVSEALEPVAIDRLSEQIGARPTHILNDLA